VNAILVRRGPPFSPARPSSRRRPQTLIPVWRGDRVIPPVDVLYRVVVGGGGGGANTVAAAITAAVAIIVFTANVPTSVIAAEAGASISPAAADRSVGGCHAAVGLRAGKEKILFLRWFGSFFLFCLGAKNYDTIVFFPANPRMASTIHSFTSIIERQYDSQC
jgi:hypothetical protein